MKKDIYIIKNTINDKVYIGQSVNSAERWVKHISESKNGRNNVISKAMSKYGVENFYYQVIESQIENYDEREKYWIKHFNSLVPNGYNVAIGGSGVGYGVFHPNAVFKNQEVVDSIVKDIKCSKLSFHKIAEKYECNETLISEINRGVSYFNKELDYPIRMSRKDKETIKQIMYSLQYENDKSMHHIAKEYNIDYSTLSDINNGNLHKIDGKEYPLRKGRVFSSIQDYVPEVIRLLKESDMMQKDIARMFNVSTTWVSSINKGKIYFSENEEYPLRKNYQCNNGGRKSFSPDEIREIEDLLKNHSEISIRKIANMFETTPSMINNINVGSIIRFKKAEIEYPLRKITPVSTIHV